MTAHAYAPDTSGLLREAAALRCEGEQLWQRLIAANVPFEGQAGPVNGIAICNMAEAQIGRRFGQRIPHGYDRDVQVLRRAAEQASAPGTLSAWLARVVALWRDVSAEEESA